MDRRTHAWIAVRAIALLEDEGKNESLVRLLKPRAQHAAVGAWIPDLGDAKRGGSKTENHILKIKPLPNGDRYFVVKKDELLSRLGSYRAMADLIEVDVGLDKAWWNTPYKGDIRMPGQHLANRAMAMSTMNIDLLIMGDNAVDLLLPGTVDFAPELAGDARTRIDQVSLYFFILSHFVADSCMPCHCDARKLSTYSKGLHNKLEKHWSGLVGNAFDDDELDAGGYSSSELLDRAREVDARFDIHFRQNHVPRIKAKDIWVETINVCRASFALASMIAPPGSYPYDDDSLKAPYNQVLGTGNPALSAQIDKAVMHDAVLNVAMVWKDVWKDAE